ncbi:hypothetical protein ABT403_14715 [Streptomyces sp. NPDC000075]|uniref:hypothetical protein n=1 Tax=Streptomyces TaxID=1883 RepID=UPI0031D47307
MTEVFGELPPGGPGVAEVGEQHVLADELLERGGVCGFSELQRERDRALLTNGSGSREGSAEDALRGIDAWLERLRDRHREARYVAFRAAAHDLRARLIVERPRQYAAPCWPSPGRPDPASARRPSAG